MSTMIKSEFNRMLEAARSFSRENDSDTVLFLGHPTDPLPRALLFDKDLPAWARIIWWCLRTYSDSPASVNAAPSYEDLQKLLGIGSRSTVASAIHALRVTRWITLLPETGPNRRSIYLLHTIPPDFHQTVELDPYYLDQIDKATRSSNKTIRILTQRILDGGMLADWSGDANGDLFRLAGHAARKYASAEQGEGAMFSDFLLMRTSREPGQEEGGEEDDAPPAEHVPIELDFHETILGLDPLMEKVARTKLNGLPPEYRQQLLDDLAVRILEGVNGEKQPVDNPLGYISWMVNRYRGEGDLVLTGKGRRLAEIVAQHEQAKRARDEKPLHEELQKLTMELAHLRRTIQRSDTPAEWMHHDLERTERRIEELRSQLPGGAYGPS